MKNPIEGINKLFESRVRLGVMSILMVNDWVDFTSLKRYLEITDGNLASHLKALEANKFIEVRKQFVGRKPKTTYRSTAKGQTAFKAHLEALEQFIQKS